VVDEGGPPAASPHSPPLPAPPGQGGLSGRLRGPDVERGHRPGMAPNCSAPEGSRRRRPTAEPIKTFERESYILRRASAYLSLKQDLISRPAHLIAVVISNDEDLFQGTSC